MPLEKVRVFQSPPENFVLEVYLIIRYNIGFQKGGLMLRYEPVSGILRFYPKNVEDGDDSPEYEASCTVVWESKSVIWIKGLSGRFSRNSLADLIKFIFDNRILKVKTHRNSGILPFSTIRDNTYCEVDVQEAKPKLLAYLNRYEPKA